jgi:hypothetical protein
MRTSNSLAKKESHYCKHLNSVAYIEKENKTRQFVHCSPVLRRPKIMQPKKGVPSIIAVWLAAYSNESQKSFGF